MIPTPFKAARSYHLSSRTLSKCSVLNEVLLNFFFNEDSGSKLRENAWVGMPTQG